MNKSAAIASRCLGDKIFSFLCAAAAVAKVCSTVFHLGKRRNTSNHYQNRWAVAKLQSAEIDRIVNYHSKYCQTGLCKVLDQNYTLWLTQMKLREVNIIQMLLDLRVSVGFGQEDDSFKKSGDSSAVKHLNELLGINLCWNLIFYSC